MLLRSARYGGDFCERDGWLGHGLVLRCVRTYVLGTSNLNCQAVAIAIVTAIVCRECCRRAIVSIQRGIRDTIEVQIF